MLHGELVCERELLYMNGPDTRTTVQSGTARGRGQWGRAPSGPHLTRQEGERREGLDSPGPHISSHGCLAGERWSLLVFPLSALRDQSNQPPVFPSEGQSALHLPPSLPPLESRGRARRSDQWNHYGPAPGPQEEIPS
ncbi:hypothetical protein DPEC_G00183520 [Dallia pectoralis]|uniref:Uncharacterized protein n=1 Tax=Dallia pectoralis TaxID=75939 RepID=A0ACC2GAR8_DALPE|nr:hypothetical protein DPEC_G00183520 [Dallia pectoralis]